MDNHQDPEMREEAVDKSAAQVSKRRLLQGLATVPVVMSVTSRPVWAAGCSVSGQLSGNLSDPTRNDCTPKVEGKSPGYWCLWQVIFDALTVIGVKKWDQLTDDQKEPFKKFDKGEGNAINVLYNWSIAAFANTDTRVDLHPTNSSGVMSSFGSAICDTGNQIDRHMTAGLLSAAHPGIDFPYPGNEWTVSYMLDKYNSTDPAERDTLDDLLRQFFSDHLEPGLSNLASKAGINSAKDAYYWAITYLNFPDPR